MSTALGVAYGGTDRIVRAVIVMLQHDAIVVDRFTRLGRTESSSIPRKHSGPLRDNFSATLEVLPAPIYLHSIVQRVKSCYGNRFPGRPLLILGIPWVQTSSPPSVKGQLS